MNGTKMVSLFVTENLEVTIRIVTLQEKFESGDLVVMENSVSIPAVFRQERGVIADFGTLVLRQC